MLRYLIPLGIFLVVVVFLAIGLGRDPREVPSPLINKAAPTFRLPELKDPSKTFSAADMRGKVWIWSVWASWCVSCRDPREVPSPLINKAAPTFRLPELKDPSK